MHKSLLTLLLCALAFSSPCQDTAEGKKSILGWNSISILSDGINFFGQTRLYDHFYLGLETGYQFGPGGSYVLIDDGYEEYRLQGGFFKINPLYVWSVGNVQWQAGPVYIASIYDESAIYKLTETRSQASDLAHGIGLHFSANIFFGSAWGMRIGIQQSLPFRQHYARDKNLTYYPGMGAEILGPLLHQGFLGILYRW